MNTKNPAVPHRHTKVERREILPIRVVDGVRVFVHRYAPAPADEERYNAWWAGVIARRIGEVK